MYAIGTSRAERVAAQEETDRPADAARLELALQRREVAAGGDAVASGARQSSRRAASMSLATASARVGCRSAASSASGAILPPARKRPWRGRRRQLGQLVQLECETQAKHDQHVDCVMLARDELAQRTRRPDPQRPSASSTLERVARCQGMLEGRQVFGALVLGPSVGERAGEMTGSGSRQATSRSTARASSG